MNQSPAAEILILADDEPTARRWAAILQGPQCPIWLSADDVPDSVQLDLILTDQNPSDQARVAGPGRRRFGQADGGEPGVIRVGVEGPADVQLPTDVTERELRLACRLLAQVVRLRRKDRTRRRMHRRLALEALTDPVTGLPNRRAWDQTLQERLTATQSGPGRLCLAVIDLDHFKRVNDTHGHAAGDAVLRAAGKVLSGGLREDDFVARLGGDEFGLLLSVPDEATARAVVDRVRGSLPSGLGRAGTPVVTASAGFHLPPDSHDPTALPCPALLFNAADTALREAKRQGRDRTVEA